MSSEVSRSILVVDSDEGVQTYLNKQKQSARFPTRFAQTGAEAQMMLANREIGLCGVFISPSVQKPNWISVVRASHMHRPATPIYMITNVHEKIDNLSVVDLKKLGVRKVLHKPIPYRDMISLITPIVLSFNMDDAIQQSKQYDQLGLIEDKSFVPIRADDFLSGAQTLFDVFVRLGKDKFIKLIHAGDAFTSDRLEKYMRKGLQYFWIRREIQEVYMSYCDHLASELIKMDGVGADIKMTQNLNLGEEVIKNLHQNGLNEMNIAYASKFVENVRNVVDQIRTEVGSKSSMMQTFLSQAALYEHGVATSMFAGLLAATLRISSENPMQVVGMAAMFHDIALAGMPDSILSEDESNMSVEEKEIFRNHPRKGVEELSRLKLLNDGALQAIEQHHMRLSGKGFPARTGTTLVSRVSDIVGISEEYAQALARQIKDPKFDIQKHIQKQIFTGFPKEMNRAFIDTFMPGSRALLND